MLIVRQLFVICATIVFWALSTSDLLAPPSGSMTFIERVSVQGSVGLAPYLATVLLMVRCRSGFRVVAAILLIVVLIVAHFYVVVSVGYPVGTEAAEAYLFNLRKYMYIETAAFVGVSAIFLKFTRHWDETDLETRNE